MSAFERIERLILRPTGGYEHHIMAALQAAQLPVAKVNTKQIRQFARACGQLATTGTTDVFILADYTKRMETSFCLPDPRRGAFLQEKNRRKKLNKQTQHWIEESLQFLLAQRQSFVEMMVVCLQADTALGQKTEFLMSLKGIGLRTAFFAGRLTGTGAAR